MHIKKFLWIFSFFALTSCAYTYSGPSIPISSDEASERIPIQLFKPEGAGPFPAIVILHDCSGLGFRSSGAPKRWANELVKQGYVILIPDSFTTRGYPEGVCTKVLTDRSEVSSLQRTHDAYAALAYSRTLSYVDGSRVGVMGGSHGGTTTLATMVAPEKMESKKSTEAIHFSAAVALYPVCASQFGTWRTERQLKFKGPVVRYIGTYQPVAPVLILIGEKDDWTPAKDCQELTQIAKKAGYPVTLTIYPGAHHSFDSTSPTRYQAARINLSVPDGRGATTGGQAQAWKQSIRAVESFFKQHL